MICLPCKSAGELNRLANQAGHDELFVQYRQMAREYHAKCDYPSNCPCHHEVGAVLAQNPGGAK